MTDIVERLRLEAADAADWNGGTMKQWDKIRALCAERDGSDLPRLMFESLIDSLVDLMIEGADEIERCHADIKSLMEQCGDQFTEIERLRKAYDESQQMVMKLIRSDGT